GLDRVEGEVLEGDAARETPGRAHAATSLPARLPIGAGAGNGLDAVALLEPRVAQAEDEAGGQIRRARAADVDRHGFHRADEHEDVEVDEVAGDGGAGQTEVEPRRFEAAGVEAARKARGEGPVRIGPQRDEDVGLRDAD